MTGYWREPDASAATLRGGWLHTGDVGASTTRASLTLKDRSKDLIISGGSNIYPREVEEVLLRHPGGARGLGDRPRPIPNGARKSWPSSWASPAPEDRASSTRSASTPSRASSGRSDYVFVEALPKNNYGKVLKTELRELDGKRNAVLNPGAAVL